MTISPTSSAGRPNPSSTTSVVAGKPFFAYVAPKPPHEPAIPAPRHAQHLRRREGSTLALLQRERRRRQTPFDTVAATAQPTQIAQIDARHEKRVESLQSVDELVEAVVGKLQNVGALDNTYVVFTSDNGWHHGEHRIKSGRRSLMRRASACRC